MIRIFKLVLLLVVSQVAFGQAPTNYTNINGRYRWIAGMFDSTFHIPKGTTPSLRTGGSTNAGGLFYNTADSSVYTYTGTQWIKLRGVIIDTTSLSNRINLKLNISDTASMLSPYARTNAVNAGLALKVNISDTASMLSPYLRKVDTTNKFVSQVYKKNGSDSVFYVRGGNHLWAFNDSTGNPGGGGGGKIYYFNGGVSMGTFGGFTMYELGDTANTGAAANFTRATTGNIANFITDPGKPGLLQIPAGVWTIDAYLSETGGGSNNAEIYAQVEKWDGSTITTIATSPIEQITNGSVIDLYTWSVSIPTTSLAVTDRIIIQFYIQNTNGKTVTLYTQNGYVGEVHTTFTTGIGAINGLTAPAQYLVTGTSGTDFNISSVTATHTFNLPTASATNRGALSSADWTAFNNKGSVSSVATNNATGITGGTITTTGTLAIDTTVISTRLWRQKGIDSVQSNLTAGLALKVNISDTSSMLLPYLRKIDTASLSNRINLKVNISDTSSMLSPYLRAIDTASLSNRINLKVNISDTASMLSPYLRKVDTASLSNRINTKLNISDTATMLGNYVNNVGYGLSKVSQVVSADSATLASYFLRRKDSLTATNLLGYVTRTVLADSAAAIRAAAGGGSVTGSGTATRVAFWNGTSSLSSNADLYWDNTNSRLGIGTTTPILKIDVIGGSTDTTTVGGTTVEQISLFRPSNGTGGIRTGFNTANGDAYIWSANSGSNLFFGTRSAPNNNINLAILSTGNIGIGTTTVGSNLQINGNAAIGYSSSTAAPTNGLAVAGASTFANNITLSASSTNALILQNSSSGESPNVTFITPVNKYNIDANATGNLRFFRENTDGTGGAVRMNLTDGGSLGIGTSTIGSTIQVNGNAAIGYSASTAAPTNGLQVAGNSILVGTVFAGNAETSGSPATGIVSGTGGTGTNIAGAEFRIRGGASTGNAAGGPITFYTSAAGSSGTGVNAATERMRLDTRGNLGLGVTPQSWTVNWKAIEVTSYGSMYGYTGGVGIGSNFFFDGSNNKYINTNFASDYYQFEGTHVWRSAASGTAGNNATLNTQMTLNASGNLGIGTSSPQQKLHVNGIILLENNQSIRWYNNAAAQRTLLTLDTNNDFQVGGSINNIRFLTNNSDERMRLDASGNLGLGTTTIGSRLQVNGNAAIGYSASTAAPTNGLQVAGNTKIQGRTSINPSSATIFADRLFEVSGSAGTTGATQFAFVLNPTFTTPTTIYGFYNSLNVTSATTSYGLYYEGESGTITNKWGLYFVGGTNNYIAGNLGLGTTTIGSKLQVNGNAAIGYSASTAGPTNGLSISGNTTIGTTTAAGKFTIDPDDNQVGLAVTGTSLTSSNAQSLIDLAQTWNTTGNPTAIKLNITNTASGANADLMELQVGGVNQFLVSKAGNTEMTGSIKTGAPSGGTAQAWKLGSVVASSVTYDPNNYVEVEINGSAYKLALAIPSEPEPLSSPDGYVPNYGPIPTKVTGPTTAEKLSEMQKEIAELRETIKLLKSKIK